MADVFLSYTRDDQATARRFAEGFERAGLSVWWDQTLRSGEAYDKVTEKALREAKAVVVLWSKKSVDSRWVRAEATLAERNQTFVPALIEPCERPIMFELTHTADLSHWKGDDSDPSWQGFLGDVRQFVGGVATSETAPEVAARPSGSNRGNTWIAPVVLVALVIGAGLLWIVMRGKEAQEPAPATTAVATVASPVTLAVLPFVNLSSDAEQEYFSDGLTEEILNQLAQIKALRVTGRTSSFSFKGKNEDLRSIAEKLGVANLLEGSVRRDGDSLRITAQLIDGRDGAHLWSQTYDRELSKIFAMQEEIARDVALALSITLDVSDMSRSQGGTTNVDAYDRYLRGRQLTMLDERKAAAQAVSEYREAVVLDPAFSRAWVELATALGTRAQFVPEETARLRREIAEVRERVKVLSPDAWWTQALIANERMEERRWLEADAAIRGALKDIADRQVPLELVTGYLDVMWGVGRVREALELGERAMKQDPLALNLARSLQAMLDCAGRPEDAQAEYERTKALGGIQGPLEWWAIARLLMRDDADATAIRAQLRTVTETLGGTKSYINWLAANYTSRLSALPVIRQAFDDPATQGLAPVWAVGMFADRFGDKDLALAALRKAAFGLQGAPNVFWFPQRTGLRSDPRFKQLVMDAGLVDYWRRSGNWGDYCRPVGAEDFECR